MSDKNPINDNLTSKIIPGLMNDYRIVSLPYWAWYWLEDFMVQNKISYQGIYDTFGENKDLNTTLREIAELHHEHSMRKVYNLSNDNQPTQQKTIKEIYSKKRITTFTLPKIYKLFGFMPCATTLEAVWERRHYEDKNKVN
jgi:uncharacterized protein YukJ